MRVERLFLVALLFLLLCFIPGTGNVVGTQLQEFTLSGSDLTLTIDYGNSTIQTFSNLSGNTVYEVTASAVEIDGEWQNNLIFVTSIAGVTNNEEEGLWWQFWVNGELAPVAANLFQVEDGDSIEWKRLPPETSETPLILDLIGSFALVGSSSLAFLALLFTIRRRRSCS